MLPASRGSEPVRMPMNAATHASRALRTTAAGLLLAASQASAIDIQFDYSFDTQGFFSAPERRNTLEAAALVFEARLTDNLTAITPGGGNSWSARFTHPGTGTLQSVSNPTIAANVLRVYAGGRDLAGSTVGEGGPGGFSAGGNQAWFDQIEYRGQLSGANNPPTDFGPWGGSITFDLGTSWHFDTDPTTLEAFPAQTDFYSVAVHELAHLLGMGIADSWYTWVDGTNFEGPATLSLNSGMPVPLTGDGAHWANGTASNVTSPVSISNQEAAMDPSIFDGTRKYFTELDFAGLDDLGWQVVPEPSVAVLLGAGTLFGCARRRRG